jgi:release factor glutamine methyltransferase
MYKPGDDSFLMEKYVKKFVKGKVLEIGVGSGILMKVALTKTKNVQGVDIDSEAVKYCKKLKLNVNESDLFSNVNGKFDFIIFNPPYLPKEEGEQEYKDLIGGEKGYETVERFFKEVGDYLEKDGEVLIVFSSLTDKEKVDEIIKKNKFKFKLLEKKDLFFETLYVYLCSKI